MPTLIILGVLALVVGMGLAMSDTARALLCKHLFEQDTTQVQQAPSSETQPSGDEPQQSNDAQY